MIIKNALVFTLDQGFVNKEVKIKNGRFTDEDIVEDTVIDAQGKLSDSWTCGHSFSRMCGT